VNGVCLTAATLTSDGFKADLLANTLKGTTLGKLLLGTKLNLEAALEVGEALGGHFVQGHVDGTVKMLSRAQLSGGDWKLVFELPAWLAAWVIDRGSITVDGVSLTVQERGPGDFTVAVISTTWGNTSLSELKPGQSVNIEADLIVKSVYHILNAMKHPEQPLTLESLQRLGYSR